MKAQSEEKKRTRNTRAIRRVKTRMLTSNTMMAFRSLAVKMRSLRKRNLK